MPNDEFDEHPRLGTGLTASRALLSAALGGLLCVASCISNDAADKDSASKAKDGAAPDVEAADASVACTDMPEAGAITSSKVDPSMTLETFTANCDALGGTFEIEPHCGGSNACKGMSFDTGTQTLTEHTCKGMNTCAGYSCIIC